MCPRGAEQAVTGLFLTPGLLEVLADECPEAFAGVREIQVGGDTAPTAARIPYRPVR